MKSRNISSVPFHRKIVLEILANASLAESSEFVNRQIFCRHSKILNAQKSINIGSEISSLLSQRKNKYFLLNKILWKKNSRNVLFAFTFEIVGKMKRWLANKSNFGRVVVLLFSSFSDERTVTRSVLVSRRFCLFFRWRKENRSSRIKRKAEFSVHVWFFVLRLLSFVLQKNWNKVRVFVLLFVRKSWRKKKSRHANKQREKGKLEFRFSVNRFERACRRMKNNKTWQRPTNLNAISFRFETKTFLSDDRWERKFTTVTRR